MDIKISIDDAAGNFAVSLAKLIADVDNAAIKSGHPTGSPEYIALLSAAVSDLVPAIANFSAALVAIKAKPLEFGVALAAELGPVLGF